MSFDESGEINSGFDIVNWVTFPNKSFLRVKVGWMNLQALPSGEFTMNEEIITWHSIFSQVRSEYTVYKTENVQKWAILARISADDVLITFNQYFYSL